MIVIHRVRQSRSVTIVSTYHLSLVGALSGLELPSKHLDGETALYVYLSSPVLISIFGRLAAIQMVRPA